jgi:mRNA deadenylase 3'-5' endonuclease subunit Ccr4
MTFTLATYNILASAYIKPEWYPDTDPTLLDDRVRLPKIAQHVAGLDVDVCCLQEVEDDAFAIVEHRLGPLGYVGHLTKKGGGRPDGCATFVREDRLRVVDCTRIEYAEGIDDAPSGHLAQALTLEVDEHILTVINTHLKWDPPNTPIDEQYGYRQVTQLLELHASEQPLRPWVVCGDFNARPGSDPVRAMEQAGFSYSHAGQANAATCNANEEAKLIDYIWFDGELRAEPFALEPVDDTTPLPGPTQPSDHIPVIARIR